MEQTKVVETAAEVVIVAPTKEPEINMYTTVFQFDHRKTNAALHMLYTKTAVVHLAAIDKTIRKFGDFANLNMLGVIDALFDERKKLVTENAAYAEADEILQSIRKRPADDRAR